MKLFKLISIFINAYKVILIHNNTYNEKESPDWFTKDAIKFSNYLSFPSNCDKNLKLNADIFGFSCKKMDNKNKFVPLQKSKNDENDKKLQKLVESKNKSIAKIKSSNESDKIKTSKTKALITKFNKKAGNICKIIKTRRFEIKFSNKQKKILKQFMIECIRVYNKCVDIYNTDSKSFNLNYKNQK